MAIINEKIIQLLQYRIEQEELSSRMYKAMSEWLEFKGYSGAAKLWQAYSDEELIHAGWTYDYLQNLNIKPIAPILQLVQNDFKGLPNIIALSYKHEVDITNQCKELAQAANKEGDFMTLQFAMKYLDEQVGELGKTQFWINKLQEFGDNGIALSLLDKEMGDK